MSQQPNEGERSSPVESRTPADQFFINAGLGSNRWWRWVLGFIAIVLAWIGIGSVVLPLVGCAFLQETNVFGLSCSDGAITGEHSLVARIVVGGSGFLIGLLGLWAVVRLIHKKPLARVVTGRSSFKYHRCLYGMLVALAVSLLIFLTNRFILGLEMTFQEPGWEYVLFLLFAIVFVPIQSGFEEVLFRGYILQGTMLLFRNKFVLAILSGVLFVLPHLTNPEASSDIVPYVVGLMANGTFFATVTLLDGGLELAVGYHAMNNLFLGLVANSEGSVMETPSLFLIHRDGYPLFPNVFIDILGLVLAVAILNRKYKWFERSRQSLAG